MNVATLHLMVGLPCSGKTTYARQLAKENNALLLTRDEWHFKLFGNDVGNKKHHERHYKIQEIMWNVAKHVLEMGGDFILDFGFWTCSERIEFKNKADKLNVNCKLHYMDVPHSEIYRRLRIRNSSLTEDAFIIPESELKKCINIFQPPTKDEIVYITTNKGETKK